MGDKLPTPNPGQGSYGQFQVNATQSSSQRPRNPLQDALVKLDANIPKTEEQWRATRQRNGFETPEDVYRTVSALIEDRLLPVDLRRLIYIAICCVDHQKDAAQAYSKYRARVDTKDLTEFTIRNYMSLVRGIVSLMDELYEVVQHRSFEAILLYAPLTLGAVACYKKVPERVKACFNKNGTSHEIQSSLPLSLPSIITSRHPEYRYGAVCRALGTNARGEEEHRQFVAVLESKKPVPREPADPPSRERYDPVRDAWCPVTIPILTGYKSFPIQESTQRLIASAGRQQDGCVRQEVHAAIVFRFKWYPSNHGVASHQVINDLKRAGLVSKGVSCGVHFFLRHESGPMTVPSGWQLIIVPAVAPTEQTMISLSYRNEEESALWGCHHGFLLSPGTTLSTVTAISYFSVALSLQ